MTELLGVVGPGGAGGVSAGKGWELELTLVPWRAAPLAGMPDGSPQVEPGEVRTDPLIVRGPVETSRLDRLVAELAPGVTVRVAVALARGPEGAVSRARLVEVVGVEPPDDRLATGGN